SWREALTCLRVHRAGARARRVLDVVPGGALLRSGLLAPEWNFEPLEGFQGVAQVFAGRAGTAGAPQLLPVEELGACLVELRLAGQVQAQRVAEVLVRLVVGQREHSSAPGQ